MQKCLLVALLAMAWPLLSAGQQFRLQDIMIPPGQSGDVKAVLEDAFGLGSMDLLIRYDPAVLQFDSVVPGTTGETIDVVGHAPRAGELRIALMTPGRLAGLGSPFAIRFLAIGRQGWTSDLNITGQAFSSETLLKMPMRFTGGRVVIGTPVIVPDPPEPSPRLAIPPIDPPLQNVDPPDVPAPAPPETVDLQIDTDLLLSLAIYTSAGLLILVLLIGLYHALRARAQHAAAGTGAKSQPDDGPIPLEPPPGDTEAPPPQITHYTPSPPPGPAADCPACNSPLVPRARFCPNCGQKLD